MKKILHLIIYFINQKNYFFYFEIEIQKLPLQKEEFHL